ncbi:MAG: hypothetical protein QXD43_04275 [Candidatus Aenigmatarchaeota archaeon]
MEKSLIIKLGDIPDNLRVILKKGYQALVIYKAIKNFKAIESLAKELKVDRSTIYCWKREWWPMKFIYLKKLMEILDIDLEDKMCYQIIGVKGEGN